ncbi:MAG: hypothetical protein WD688_18505 [Candidatus Binatia bacterium]
MKKPDPVAAIITGVGFIGFSLFYKSMGIFPHRTRGFFSRGWSAVTATEEPLRFQFVVFLTLVIGVACVIWGLLKLMKR